MYLIGVALAEANLQSPSFHRTREGQPIVIVLADGWNHALQNQTQIDLYRTIKANVLDTATVGEFKRKVPAWCANYYYVCRRIRSTRRGPISSS